MAMTFDIQSYRYRYSLVPVEDFYLDSLSFFSALLAQGYRIFIRHWKRTEFEPEKFGSIRSLVVTSGELIKVPFLVENGTNRSIAFFYVGLQFSVQTSEWIDIAPYAPSFFICLNAYVQFANVHAALDLVTHRTSVALQYQIAPAVCLHCAGLHIACVVLVQRSLPPVRSEYTYHSFNLSFFLSPS